MGTSSMINQDPVGTNSKINQEHVWANSRMNQEPNEASSRINLEPIGPKSILRRRRYKGVNHVTPGPGNSSDYSRSDLGLDISNRSDTTHRPFTDSLNPNSMNSKVLYFIYIIFTFTFPLKSHFFKFSTLATIILSIL